MHCNYVVSHSCTWINLKLLFLLTLPGTFEAEGLKSSGQRRRVDDINAILALVPPVQRYSDDQHDDGNYTRSQTRVEGYIIITLHISWKKRK